MKEGGHGKSAGDAARSCQQNLRGNSAGRRKRKKAIFEKLNQVQLWLRQHDAVHSSAGTGQL